MCRLLPHLEAAPFGLRSRATHCMHMHLHRAERRHVNMRAAPLLDILTDIQDHNSNPLTRGGEIVTLSVSCAGVQVCWKWGGEGEWTTCGIGCGRPKQDRAVPPWHALWGF
jgi:hypothetical protein